MRRLAPALLLLLLVGCTTPYTRPVSPLGTELAQHVVMYERRGLPVKLVERPLGRLLPYGEMTDAEYNAHMRGVIGGIETEAAAGRIPNGVLLFVHGGLNSQKGTLTRARKLAPQIARAGYYPLFLNWQSSLISSYLIEHLFLLRLGRERPVWQGALSMPFVLVGDLLRGVARAPFVVVSDLRGVAGLAPHEELEARAISRTLRARYRSACCPAGPPGNDVLPISLADDSRSFLGKALTGTRWLVTFPLTLVIDPFFDAVGTSSWNVMERRIRLLFRSEAPLLDGDPTLPGPAPLPRFLAALREVTDRESIPLTGVAHSMGSIVMNEILRRDALRLERLVFMAAACSLRDYDEIVVPAIVERRVLEHYHLTLHPGAEVRESFAGLDVAPRGSLLVWIDDFLAQPRTLWDRTAGRYWSLMHAVNGTPESLRERVHVKGFPAGRAAAPGDPTRHGDFSDAEFWRPGFWEPEKPCGCAP